MKDAAGHDVSGPVRPCDHVHVIRTWLVNKCSETLDVPPAHVDVREPIATYGFGSVQAVSLVGELEEWLGRELPATLFWDYPSLDALAMHLAEMHDDDPHLDNGRSSSARGVAHDCPK